MALPLIDYKPTTQNQRVASFGTADQNEDTPYVYRIEDVGSAEDMKQLIRAAYWQVFSEHEMLAFNRHVTLETKVSNGVITVRDFIRGLAKSEAFYRLVVSVNNNYRLVDLCLRRFLGRPAYNRDEEIAWSIVIATKGFNGFVDALLDSAEYTAAFGNYTVPYQRKRLGGNVEGRPFNLVTPRYGEDFQEKAGTVTTDWQFVVNRFYTRKFQDRRLAEGDPRRFRELAASIAPKGNYAQRLSSFDIDYLNKVPRKA